MKNVYIKFILLFALLTFLCLSTPVYAANDYFKDISIAFNHNGCDEEVGKEITIQLFKDGVVEGNPVILNSANNYTYTYEHLLIFGPESPDEIKYNVIKIPKAGIHALARSISRPRSQTFR